MPDVKTVAELRLLTRRKLPRCSADKVFLDLPILTEYENKLQSAYLNNKLCECGCQMGARFTLAGLVASFLLVIDRANWTAAGILVGVAISISLVVLGGLVGKVVGIGMSRVLFSWKCLQLIDRMNDDADV